MQKKYKNVAICATLLSLGLTGLATAEECVPIQGKIFNNALGPGTTLGTVHLIYGKGKEKLKCGLKGDGKYRNEDDPNNGLR